MTRWTNRQTDRLRTWYNMVFQLPVWRDRGIKVTARIYTPAVNHVNNSCNTSQHIWTKKSINDNATSSLRAPVCSHNYTVVILVTHVNNLSVTKICDNGIYIPVINMTLS